MRRFAPIAVGAAVAYILLLPAAAAWLRQPASTPLPGPVTLVKPGDSGLSDAYAVSDRVHSKLLSRSHPAERTMRAEERRRPATHRARPVLLAPTSARRVASGPVEEDDDDDGVHALGDDELGDG